IADSSEPDLTDSSLPQPRLDSTVAPDLRLGPPYPIVLAHGFFGFEQIGPLEYFYKVPDALRAAGHQVFVTSVDPFNTTYVRGLQLLSQIKDLLAQTGAAKVNIIGHSQGGLDALFVAAQIPDRIAAIVTISTPHQGTAIADVLTGDTPGALKDLAQAFISAVAPTAYGDISDNADIQACLEFLTTASISEFNDAYPLPPGVAGFSLAGRSLMSRAEDACATDQPLFAALADERDPLEPLLSLTGAYLAGSLLHPEPNDGLVTVASAHWQTWLGCVPADHFDEIGQLLGDSPGPGNSFDYLQLYLDLADFLVQQGF
ncbi:MAG: esterase/lipase family protein, partial [Anaerolineae bacterium]